MNVSYIGVITIACTVYILHNQWFSGSQVSKILESWKLSKTPENWQNLGISNVKLLMYAILLQFVTLAICVSFLSLSHSAPLFLSSLSLLL
jgi:hypothetical protein